MKNKERLEMITSYIKTNVGPILIENIPSDIFNKNTVILEANININDLTGHYEETEFLPPKWYKELETYQSDNYCFLVINKISSLPKEEQLKFKEILKYRKVSTFDLPKNCVIILTGDKKIEDISESIYSLLAIM